MVVLVSNGFAVVVLSGSNFYDGGSGGCFHMVLVVVSDGNGGADGSCDGEIGRAHV